MAATTDRIPVQTTLSDVTPGFPVPEETAVMHVRKRNGSLEPVDVNKIVRAVQRCAHGLQHVDSIRVASKTIGGLYDGATTQELDKISIDTAASLIAEEPQYSRLAARLLLATITKEVSNFNLYSFSQSINYGHHEGVVSNATAEFVHTHARKLNDAIDDSFSDRFEYFGLRTVYDRYLLRDPLSRRIIETPQHFFLRVACGLAQSPNEAINFYRLIASLDYLPSSPTLFNSGTKHAQMSSCYLHDSPLDSLDSIYDTYKNVALLSKFSGGIGLAFHRVRSEGSLIRATNGLSNGIVPWLRTLDSSVAAVNQGGKRKGACCVYLEPWHADIEQFLELRDNTGDVARRTHNLNLANWISDLFMQRVEADGTWSLFDPKDVPQLPDLYGDDFKAAYEKAEEEKLYRRQIKARDLYARMMRTLAETGNGWMTFKDATNLKCNQTGEQGNVVHLSNLCTEITEVTSSDQTAVCNLGSINLGRHVTWDADGRPSFDFEKLARTVHTAVPMLDRVIDINYYPIEEAASSNAKWRPVGLGLMGLQDVFFQMRLAFDSPEAQALSTRIQEEIYYAAMEATCELAEKYGPHETFAQTRMAKGKFQFDLWGVQPADLARWEALRARIAKSGVRNSLLIAIAPTATIASIAGCYECIEPQISNLFKRETLSGEFLQVNRYLIDELKARNLWNEEMRVRLKMAEGSVQGIEELPEDVRLLYRTVWEIPMRSLIDMAAARNAYLDQSQSLNLFAESPNIGRLSSMYMYAWKKGLKTTYYLRSRPATKIAKTTVPGAAARVSAPAAPAPAVTASAAIACSLENPESCEACQ
ncbi:ribonucleoside-diphosphate reductase subunit alpha [Silvibacterium dinghuense]|uniref:Ribonucleoside-diphosphate reductase n=1 Tax=Silvibacterium dinghuense TaxID=1560006 RepID=A0A4Q1SEN7_9BACT|nr:ribonucleoside-diphosphate reductase subunit alpha [Silvibacterium dinghuense]RXS95551.1 ribonucleoside-diphosphate reductase subunit alpha [Silvibacterium dinghuense]GGH13960.1 ribonucleoside-diphosphate reductase [Silvibacterium dinghuense]